MKLALGMLLLSLSLSLSLALAAPATAILGVPNGSMVPTIVVGDRVLIDLDARQPKRGDVVMYQSPTGPDRHIHRVVGVGGDTVEERDGALFINGKPVPHAPVDKECRYDDYVEPWQAWTELRCRAVEEQLESHRYQVVYAAQPQTRAARKWTVPAGSFFVMGDNRDNAYDSRYVGPIASSLIRGTARSVVSSSGPHGSRLERANKRIE